MKKLVLLVCLLSGSAFAQCTTSYIGTTAYTNCNNGYNATTQQIGNTTYTNGTYNGQRTSTTCTTIGNTRYCN